MEHPRDDMPEPEPMRLEDGTEVPWERLKIAAGPRKMQAELTVQDKDGKEYQLELEQRFPGAWLARRPDGQQFFTVYTEGHVKLVNEDGSG